MANANFTLPTLISTEESRAGAIAGRDALCKMEIFIDSESSDMSMKECRQSEIKAISSVLLAAGDIPQHAQGMILAMAEYIYFCMTAGEPDLKRWKPEAAMTEQGRDEWWAILEAPWLEEESVACQKPF